MELTQRYHPQFVRSKYNWITFVYLCTAFYLALQMDPTFSVEFLRPEETLENVGATIENIVLANNPVRRAGYLMIGLFGFVSLLWGKNYRLRINGILGLLVIFFVFWVFISVVWSDDVALAARRVAVFVMLSLGAVGMAIRFSSKDVMLFAFSAGLFTLSFGLMCEIYLGTFHPLSIEYRFSGLMPPLYQAIDNSMLIIAALALSRGSKSGRFVYYLVAFGAFIFIILSKARWPMFAISLTMISYCIRVSSRARLLVYVCLIVCTGCLVYFVAGDTAYNFMHSSIALGRDTSSASTLTGRLPVWKEGLKYFLERPLLGYGYDSFWTPQRFLKVAQASEFAVADFHNGYLNLLIGLGIPGLTAGIMILSLATMKLNALSTLSYKTYNIFSVNLLVMVIMNMFLMTLLPGGHFCSFVSMTIIARVAFAGEPHCQPAKH